MSPVDPSNPLAVFFALAVAHALADFPLQGDFIARQKSRASSTGTSEWIICLCAHALIHAGGVWLVTGSIWLGAVELVLHAGIDFGKGEEKFGLAADQLLHLACKVAYAGLLATGLVC